MQGENKESVSSSKVISYMLLVLGILSLLGGGWLLYGEWKRQKAMPAPGTASGASSASTGTVGTALDNVVEKVKTAVTTITTPKNVFPLQKGSKGNEVTNLQRYLNVRWKAGLEDDGIWGKDTDKAIQTFEKTSSVTAAEYAKMKQWLDTFPHEPSFTIKPKDVVINQFTTDHGYL